MRLVGLRLRVGCLGGEGKPVTTQLVLFDYQQLDTETRTIVRQRTIEIKALMKRTAQDIIEIGEKLIDVKERLGHGNFGGWLEVEFGWSWSTANNFMRVAGKFATVTNLEDFSAKALYLLAAPSTPDEARDEAITRAQNGVTITYTQAREIVNSYKTTDTRAGYSPNGNGHTFENTAPIIPIDTRPLFDDPELDAALNDELKQVCPECGQVYDGQNCPDCTETEIVTMPHVVHNSGDNEWYTPQEYADAARIVMGNIDLDPASTEIANSIVMAKTFYDASSDGLTKDWAGKVWMNPPYAREFIQRFCEKLARHYQAGDVQEAIVLVNNATETIWFQRLAEYSSALCLPEGRVQFWHPEKVSFPLQGQAVLYLGNNPGLFASEFKKFGTVWQQGY